MFADSLMSESLRERTRPYTKVAALQTLGRGVSAALNGLALLASKGSEDWDGFRTKATLLAGFVLLFPTIAVLSAFRDPVTSKRAEIAEEETVETVRGHRFVPYFLVMSLFCSSVGAGLIVKFLPLFFIHTHGLSPEGLSLLQCISAFVVAVLTKILGDYAHCCGRAPMSASCLAGCALCLILMSKIANLWAIFALFMLRASLATANFALIWSSLMDCTPSSQRGLWTSLISVLSMSWSASAVAGGVIASMSYEVSFQAPTACRHGLCIT